MFPVGEFATSNDGSSQCFPSVNARTSGSDYLDCGDETLLTSSGAFTAVALPSQPTLCVETTTRMTTFGNDDLKDDQEIEIGRQIGSFRDS